MTTTSTPSATTSASAAPAFRPPARGSLASSLWTMYTLTLRQHMHGKRWMVMTLLFVIPAALAVIIRATAPDAPGVDMEFGLVFMFLPQAILPLVALVYASGLTQDEQEDQTFTYLLVRPIPKWAIYLFKLLATLTTTVLLTVFFTGLIYMAIYAGRDNGDLHPMQRFFTAAALHSLAMIAYCCIFGLLGLVTGRPLIVGILYTAVVEGLFANMPFGIRMITVIYYARMIAYRALPFLDMTPRGPQNIASDAWQIDTFRDPKLLEYPGVNASLMVLIIGSLCCALLAAFLCSRREFHVKTPEKN